MLPSSSRPTQLTDGGVFVRPVAAVINAVAQFVARKTNGVEAPANQILFLGVVERKIMN